VSLLRVINIVKGTLDQTESDHMSHLEGYDDGDDGVKQDHRER
jgi:hypothetical protein